MSRISGSPVRISIPYKIANDLGAYKQAVTDALTKLGCPACCSGHDIYFDTEKYFRMTKGFELQPLAGVSAVSFEEPKPAHRVVMDSAILSSIEDVYSTIDKVAELSGCATCCSGMDLFFENKISQIQLTTFRNGL